jgi:hypothetical protein
MQIRITNDTVPLPRPPQHIWNSASRKKSNLISHLRCNRHQANEAQARPTKLPPLNKRNMTRLKVPLLYLKLSLKSSPVPGPTIRVQVRQ